MLRENSYTREISENRWRVIVTAGGTGGHIFPAIAIAEELRSKGVEVLYVGNVRSMEERITGERGLPFAPINVQKLYRSLTPKHILFPVKLIGSCFRGFRILKEFRPHACIGVGGFVSGPVIFCAALKKIPVYLQEQNSAPGLTTKILSRYACRIFTGYVSAARYLPNSKTIFTGNPLQRKFQNDQKRDRDKKNMTSKLLTLFIMGGSQGAQSINNSVLEILDDLLKLNIYLIWQTGSANYEHIRNTIKDQTQSSKIELFPFSDDMPGIYSKTDIAVTRAGAISLAELEVMKIPAIIIPLSKSAGNHQYMNAKFAVEKKRAIIIPQDSLDPQVLLNEIRRLISFYDIYRNNFNDSPHGKATSLISDLILNDLNTATEQDSFKRQEVPEDVR